MHFKDYITEASKWIDEGKEDKDAQALYVATEGYEEDEDQDEITEATSPADKAKVDAATKVWKSTKKIPKGFGVAFGKLFIKKAGAAKTTDSVGYKGHTASKDLAKSHDDSEMSLLGLDDENFDHLDHHMIAGKHGYDHKAHQRLHDGFEDMTRNSNKKERDVLRAKLKEHTKKALKVHGDMIDHNKEN